MYWVGLVLDIEHADHFVDWEAVGKGGEDLARVGVTEPDACDAGAGEEASVAASGREGAYLEASHMEDVHKLLEEGLKDGERKIHHLE